MPELHNGSIFANVFVLSVYVMGWVMTVAQTDGGVRFGKGCRRKAR